MSSRPPSPNRAGFDSAAFDIGSHLKRVFSSVGFDPTELSELGRPGSYHGTSRCGGDTYGFALKHFACEVMSKFDDEKSESDKAKTDVATSRFEEAERLCADTNERFRTYFYGFRPANEQVSRVICRAREKIGNLLAGVDWNRVRTGCTFTSGSSVTMRRGSSTSIHKYSAKVESTTSALSIVSETFSQIPALKGGIADDSGIKMVPGNKLTCVPKNYKTHRMIAGEASGNMYLQKGMHTEIRRLLKSVGVDLSDQRQNQDWALLGSRSGLVATVDMSMASDTVSYHVVEWLYSLVPEVFDYLDRCRALEGKLASRTVTYEKFSSMGNATTFEIESSIFWALATAVCDVSRADSRFVGVYGDDVVLPNRCVPLFFEVLKECGFVPNESKTFWELNPHPMQKRFRESCGKHYYLGQDVTPVYIRKQPKDLLDYFKVVNNLVRWLRRLEDLPDAPCLDMAWEYVKEMRSKAPAKWMKPRIPDGYGDGAFIGTFDECTPSTYKGRKSLWVEGYRIEVLTERFIRAVGRSHAGFPLYRKPSDGKLGRLQTLERPRSKRFVTGITFTGYALSSLERLENMSLPHDVLRNSSAPRTVRDLALALAGKELSTEGMSIEIPSTRQVAPGTLTIPRSVSW